MQQRPIPINLTAIALGACVLLIAVLRIVTYYEPPNRDICVFAVIATEWLSGRQIYSDLWDHKPPGIFWTYALAQLVAGRGMLSIYLLAVVGSVITMLGIYQAAAFRRRLRPAGICAALSFAVVSGDLYLNGNITATELFMNAALAWVFALLLRLRPRALMAGRCTAIGILLGIASLYKTTVIAQAVGLALVYVVWFRSSRFRKTSFMQMCVSASAAIGVWAGVCVYFLAQGSFRDFYEAVFLHNFFYTGLESSGMLANIVRGFRPDLLLPRSVWCLIPLAVVGIAGALSAPRRQVSFTAACMAAYCVSTYVAVAMAGQFAAHYYQLWLPPACVAGGWGAYVLSARIGRIRPQWRSVPCVLLLLMLVMTQTAYLMPPVAWARVHLGTDPELERRTGQWLRSVLPPGGTFYQWGSVTGLYFAAEVHPPTGVLYLGPLLGSPIRAKLEARTVHDLERTRPELIVLDARDVPPMPDNPVVQWIAAHYTFIGKDPIMGRFDVLKPRDL